MHRLTVAIEAMLGRESGRAGVAAAGNTENLSVTFACVRATMKHHVVSIRTKRIREYAARRKMKEGTSNLHCNFHHKKLELGGRIDSRAQRAH
jgi:hypothetical protein